MSEPLTNDSYSGKGNECDYFLVTFIAQDAQEVLVKVSCSKKGAVVENAVYDINKLQETGVCTHMILITLRELICSKVRYVLLLSAPNTLIFRHEILI